MRVNILWWVAPARHLCRITAEPGVAAQLCVFTLGMWYLYLGVLMGVFRVKCAVYVLVSECRQDVF